MGPAERTPAKAPARSRAVARGISSWIRTWFAWASVVAAIRAFCSTIALSRERRATKPTSPPRMTVREPRTASSIFP